MARSRAAIPLRYGPRYGSGPPTPPRRLCPACPALVLSGRARYYSDACKQRAYRLRQRAAEAPDLPSLAAALRRLGDLAAHTVYACLPCDERSLGERRCPDCHRVCRALGLGGACPDCDRPVLIAELLGPEVPSEPARLWTWGQRSGCCHTCPQARRRRGSRPGSDLRKERRPQ